MDKKTILAVILITIVITVSMVIQGTMFSNNTTTENTTSTEQTVAESTSSTATAEAAKTTAVVPSSLNKSTEKFLIETDLYVIEFDPVGASISSLMLKEHADADGEHVDLVFRGDNDHNAFLMYWGDDFKTPVLDTFSYAVEGEKVIFTNDYTASNGAKFTVIKTFEFKDGEYLFAVTVDIVGDEKFAGLSGDYAYSLAYEPQVGPAFTQMKNNAYDYRRVYIDAYNNKGKLKKSQAKISNGEFYTTSQLQWMSVTGKYFMVVALPEDNTLHYKYTALRSSTDDVVQTDSLYISVPSTSGSSSNTIYYYVGPQLKKYLGSYYSGMDNAWGLRATNLDAAMESGSMFGWLENILKWALNLLYKLIPNYGVGIILLTIIIKIILWPLSKKAAASTAKMSALQPRQKELQEKYKDNPQKLNQEMAALYKEAGASPLGGCLPMLIQFPILIAMYGLLNKHFELRGAMFIPGWIPDLSVPETIATLGFNLPLLGNEIHLLPILYTVSMIFSMKITQTQSSSAQGGGMMKFMTYGMPIIFFFILYSAPSGLLLYWSAQNALAMIQQVYTNKKFQNNPSSLDKPKASEEKVPEVVRRYQEKLKRLEEEKAKAAKGQQSNGKKKK
ncbi:MAG: membrane protein insertase YidC [Spirochaetales bacterium]|nr:membrane protein insertase YidC [Spirochaetales bacterium]